MHNILLTIKTKLVLSFILVSIFILTLIYITFNSLFQEHMLKSEEEKAILIAQTIEPMIGINYYLGLNDDIKQLAKQTTENDNIESLRITIQKKEIFFCHTMNNKDTFMLNIRLKTLLHSFKSEQLIYFTNLKILIKLLMLFKQK